MAEQGDRKVIVFAASFLDEPITESPNAGAARSMLEKAAAQAGVAVDYRCTRNPSRALEAAELEGAVAVIADLEHYDRQLLRQVGDGCGGPLALIARYGVGYTSVDIEAAKECGVLVTNTPAANASPTAEWAVATMLDVAGKRRFHHQRAAAGQSKAGTMRLDLGGKTLGIVGTGTVGKRVAALLRGFDMRVLAYDLYPDSDWAAANGVDYVELPTLYENADFVTLHASSAETIIGKAELDRMKHTAVLVNCARGHLVDNREAYQAVAEGRLWGYGLDEVWEYSDLSLDEVNVVVSPHVGSDTDFGKENMKMMSARAVATFLRGEKPDYVVNR
ncbi:MAG: NAD(P)-dependent oxidoreductase [Spirochaetia bacterium]